MKAYSKKMLDEYMVSDPLAHELGKYPEDAVFASHRWLQDMPAKRMIYWDIYGPLLKEEGKRILDVGGGFASPTREMVTRHDYQLLDPMIHGGHAELVNIEKKLGSFWISKDWHSYEPEGEYDYVIANDIFPNVDQRLGSFIRTFQGKTKHLFITLTCYDKERSYLVKRIDAEEVLTIQPWSSSMTELVLREQVGASAPALEGGDSLFPNGRLVYRLDL